MREGPSLRRVKAVIDWERCRGLRAAASCPDLGRPAIEPLLLLKLEFLQYQYNPSDGPVIEQARCPMAQRYFLDLGLHSRWPHPTLLTYCRQRRGPERPPQTFDALVGQARAHGLVKDRLRLKDATHVLATIALPTTLALVAQARERLLQALVPWAAAALAQPRQRAEQIRQSTADLAGEERLRQRVAPLREGVAWAPVVGTGTPFTAAPPVPQQPLQPRCVPKFPKTTGRTVYTRDYEPDRASAHPPTAGPARPCFPGQDFCSSLASRIGGRGGFFILPAGPGK